MEEQIENNVDEKYNKEKNPKLKATLISIDKVDKVRLDNIKAPKESYAKVVARLIREHYLLQLLKKKIRIK